MTTRNTDKVGYDCKGCGVAVWIADDEYMTCGDGEHKFYKRPPTHAFSVPGSGIGIDAVHPVTGNGVWSGDTPAEMEERNPGAVPTLYEDIERIHDDKTRVAPHRIDQDRWDYALNVLPPAKWVRESGAETFHISELVSGTMADIFAWIGGDYWELTDDESLSHREILAKCLETKNS